MSSFFTSLDDLMKEAGLAVPASEVSRKKFILVGTHAHQTTGYSKVTYNIIKELSALNTFDIYHFGFQRFVAETPDGYRTYPSNVKVYDPVPFERANTFPQESGFGFSQLVPYLREVKPDVVMIYNDAGIVCQFLEKLKDLSQEERAKFKLIIYLDQVYIIQRPDFLQRMDKEADAFFAFTDFWKKTLVDQGIKKPVHVLRHGFDIDVYKQKNKTDLRKKHGIPENLFLFLNLNRNTPRKRHDVVVQAFARIVARNQTKPIGLLCVCDKGENGGYPIQEIFIRELLQMNVPAQQHIQKLMISSNPLTYTDELINELYCLSDVGITAAEGEGFGLCQFEAMGLGIPQVVPNIGGFQDFCTKENSMLVEAKWRSYLPYASSSVGGIAELVSPADIAKSAEEYIFDTSLRERHGKNARETVLKYSWKEEVAKLAHVISNA